MAQEKEPFPKDESLEVEDRQVGESVLGLGLGLGFGLGLRFGFRVSGFGFPSALPVSLAHDGTHDGMRVLLLPVEERKKESVCFVF